MNKGLAELLRPGVPEASRNELEQALLRAAIFLIITLDVWWYIRRDGHLDEPGQMLLTGLAGWLILAIGIIASMWMWPALNVSRRVLGLVGDVGAITLLLSLTGGEGAVYVWVYLFIIFGNGFWYGRYYLHLCQFLCLIGFGVVLVISSWWSHQLTVGFGWLMAITVLPSYVGVLTERTNEARVKAEGALKECVERQRGNGA